jgi:hypothetical protein
MFSFRSVSDTGLVVYLQLPGSAVNFCRFGEGDGSDESTERMFMFPQFCLAIKSAPVRDNVCHVYSVSSSYGAGEIHSP